MGNLIELPNINPESLILDGNESKPQRNGNFNLKNYLNVRLDEGETEKTITIRLLPMDLKTGSPFVKVHVHNVKVPKELVKQGQKPFKDYICLSKTADIDHEKFGNKCPFCEINKSAYNESLKCTDPVQKKEWQDISLDNLAREAVIVRCIERGKEDEGVKFWKFKIRSDKADPYNQIIKLYQLRKANAEKKGQTENILDIYNGRDLNITITAAQGTSAPQIVDDSDRSPLSTDEEQMKKWIYDEKKWQDVFTCKPYEYLKLVSEMRIPWFDKENNIWVDKEEYENVHGIQKTEAEQEAKDASEEMKNLAKSAEAAPVTSKVEEKKESFAASITVDDDDLPF
jgi:hypothetical protein